MAEMLIIWVLVPFTLLLVCYGLGLLVAMSVGKPMNATITISLGFLVITIIGSLLVSSTKIAPYSALTIGILGFGSFLFALIMKRGFFRIDFLSGLAGLITYLAYGLPLIAYGSPSWAGWIKLDDQATFLAVTDRLMNVGRTIPDPVLSTYQRVIQTIFDTHAGHFSYPVGSFMPLGVMSKVTGVESAWLFQPYLAFCAGLTAGLFVIVLRSYLKSRNAIFSISVISVLASTLYSYAMWGAIKELVILVPLTTFGLTLFAALRSKTPAVYYFLTGISLASLFYVGGSASLGFVAPILFIAVLLKFPSKNRRRLNAIFVIGALCAVGITYYLRAANNPIAMFLIPVLGDQGNMVRALHLGQIMGIWPAADFRMESQYPLATYILITLALLFSAFGAYFSIRRRLWIIPTLLGTVLAVTLNAHFWGGIWLSGKATAIASPFFLLAAGVGFHAAWDEIRFSRNRYLTRFKTHYGIAALALVVGISVVGSDLITYKNVWLAPNSQMKDLQKIGKLFAGQGPTLMTEYSVFGSRYFLRKSDAEAASELRVHVIPTRDGQQVPKGFAADIDLFDGATIDYFNLLVLRKSPNSSRPPLNYSLAYSGNNYEVWKKSNTKLTVKAMLPLGDTFSSGATPNCDTVEKFLASRTPGDRIYKVVRSPDYVVDFSVGDLPVNWVPVLPNTGAVDRVGSGSFSRSLTINASGDYGIYLAGSHPGRVEVQVDGVRVYSGSMIFEGNPFLTNPLGKLRLDAGIHTVTVSYSSPLLAPGADSSSRFGPIYFSTQVAGDAKVQAVKAAEIPNLCQENLDWIAIAR